MGEGRRALKGRAWTGGMWRSTPITHLFPPPEHYPWRLVAFCGAMFWSADLEWLDEPADVSCTDCRASARLVPARP